MFCADENIISPRGPITINYQPGTYMWDKCLSRLETELPEQQFNTWIRPLHAIENSERLRLLAPNRFVLDWVEEHFLNRIKEIILVQNSVLSVSMEIGTLQQQPSTHTINNDVSNQSIRSDVRSEPSRSNLDPNFTFSNFVQGKSNELAKAASQQVAENPGDTYNPLFIYGATGLGKTHLMQAVGNKILAKNPAAKVIYLHSERFVSDMVKALQHNTIDAFKRFYRTVDALLIDDIQFFAGKERSQEEFFHTFNTLLESQQQVILTCDRYPKEVEGLEDRLKSRFGWGLTVAIDPPELETRAAIIKSKAEQAHIEIPDDVAFFVAKRIQSNVRELEGVLRRLIAHAQFTDKPITMELTQEALRDLLAMQERMVSIENIQKTVAEYYKIRVSDLHSKSRSRSITRPRQLAMSLAKELTSHSLPEIGDAFGGRDHTTVLHACRKIGELRESDNRIREDYQNLLRTFTA